MNPTATSLSHLCVGFYPINQFIQFIQNDEINSGSGASETLAIFVGFNSGPKLRVAWVRNRNDV